MTKEHKLVNHTPSFKIHDVQGCISLRQEHSGLQRCFHCFMIIIYILNFFASLSKDKTNSPIHFKVGGSVCTWQHRGFEPLYAWSSFKCLYVYNNLYSHNISLHVHRVYNILPVELHYETETAERGWLEMKSCSRLPDSLHRESSSHPLPSTFPVRSRILQRGCWLFLPLPSLKMYFSPHSAYHDKIASCLLLHQTTFFFSF